MYKYFDELGFKAGDTVKCVKNKGRYVVGKTYTILGEGTDLYIEVDNDYPSGFYGSWELVEPVVPEFTSTDIYSAYLSSRAVTERLLLAYSDKRYEGSDYNLTLVKEELVELIKCLEAINIKLNSDGV